jgi:hypothetical protein
MTVSEGLASAGVAAESYRLKGSILGDSELETDDAVSDTASRVVNKVNNFVDRAKRTKKEEQAQAEEEEE